MKEYIQFQNVGICKLDVKGVIKKFTLLNRVYQWLDEYYLMEYTPKCKRKMKIRISEEDAREIIESLQLRPFRDTFFVNAITYVPTT